MITIASYWRYWGKARPQTGAVACHPLPCHCLDVAAVGRRFLLQSPRLLEHWSVCLGIAQSALPDIAAFFLAAHDLGKFAVSFQAQRADLLAQLQDGRSTFKPYGPKHYHDSFGAVLAADWEFLAPIPWLYALLQGADFDAAQCWFQAVTGHHGQPPQMDLGRHTCFDAQDAAAATQFIDQAGALLWSEPARAAWLASRPGERLDAHRRFSWWLAGLAVLADWLGSNTEYFPYCAPPESLAAYWDEAQRQASRALEGSGVIPCTTASAQALGVLFPRIGADATPLQGACADVALADSPQLFVLEDVTGAGKTEAAVMLAHRLLAAGHGQGLYFALPTMATANQMYERGPDRRRPYADVDNAPPAERSPARAARIACSCSRRCWPGLKRTTAKIRCPYSSHRPARAPTGRF